MKAGVIAVNKEVFTEKIEYIVAKLEEKGYSPYDQLAGYVLLENELYITSHGDARNKIKELDVEDIKTYLKRKGIEM